MVKMNKRIKIGQNEQKSSILIKMVKIIKNDQFGQKIEKKLEKKNKSIEARDDARAQQFFTLSFFSSL